MILEHKVKTCLKLSHIKTKGFPCLVFRHNTVCSYCGTNVVEHYFIIWLTL